MCRYYCRIGRKYDFLQDLQILSELHHLHGEVKCGHYHHRANVKSSY